MSLPVKVEKFESLESDFGTTIAVALWKKATQLCDYINASYPVGMILFVHGTQSNLPHLPDSKYWKEADGTVVSNVNSPLNGVTLPDLRDQFFRHPKTGETVLSTGGQNTVNLEHNHGGFTSYWDPRASFQMDGGGDVEQADNHRHSINNDLGTAVPIIPQYIALKVYVRIV